MTKATCGVEGCARPVAGRGWCGMHYQRWQSNGDPTVVRRRFRLAAECAERDCAKPPYNRDLCLSHYRQWQAANNARCTVEGCDKPQASRGFCSTHYGRWRRHGSPDAPPPAGRKCSVDGCDERARASDLCGAHYRNLRKYGVVTAPPKPARVWPRCSAEGCDAISTRVSGMCERHYRRTARAEKPPCEVPGCDGRAQARSTFCEPHGGWSVSIFRRYSLTRERYDAILAAQGGVCAICGRPPDIQQRIKRLAVDHDHSCCAGDTSCGKCVRGLLCPWCNRFIGLAMDDPPRLVGAIRYLERSRKPQRKLPAVPGQEILPVA